VGRERDSGVPRRCGRRPWLGGPHRGRTRHRQDQAR
jgi:hypothetical protein